MSHPQLRTLQSIITLPLIPLRPTMRLKHQSKSFPSHLAWIVEFYLTRFYFFRYYSAPSYEVYTTTYAPVYQQAAPSYYQPPPAYRRR